METVDPARDNMTARIRDGLVKAETHVRMLRRTNSRLIWMTLATSAVATALAGITAATGPLAGEGPPAWRATCGVIAILTALSGLLSGTHQRLNVSERLGRAIACSGRLRSLEIALTVSGRSVGEVARDYEEVVAGYQEYVV